MALNRKEMQQKIEKNYQILITDFLL